MNPYIIETRNLTKKYGEQTSVSRLNLHVKKGRIYGLLGRNGAGKTTTMRMLLGLTAPTAGEVKVFGRPLKGNEKKLLPRIGCLIESPGFYPNLTGTENLRIFALLRGLKNPERIRSALELVNLPYRDKKLYSQYSLGMKQRLAIALAVMHDPELLILDEPINGLDPIGIAEIREFIRELCDVRGKTILISSHILSEISLLADDIGIIDHGKLLEEESLEELEGIDARIGTVIAVGREIAVVILNVLRLAFMLGAGVFDQPAVTLFFQSPAAVLAGGILQGEAVAGLAGGQVLAAGGEGILPVRVDAHGEDSVFLGCGQHAVFHRAVLSGQTGTAGGRGHDLPIGGQIEDHLIAVGDGGVARRGLGTGLGLGVGGKFRICLIYQ